MMATLIIMMKHIERVVLKGKRIHSILGHVAFDILAR